MKDSVRPNAMAREENIFDAAVQLADPAQRSACLDEACEGDTALRARIEKLLAAANDTFFNTPPAPGLVAASEAPTEPVSAGSKIATSTLPSAAPDDRIGRYKLLEKVGEGGCGVVYVAEQTEPVRRRVALKVIKPGMDTRQVVARFEAERQALAMMDHPNIAKVLDAGTTETGRAYFVMELVRGIRITDYCDQANLSTKERLDLFIKVCQAIQHAHQKGIIHRDIKPSNILVTLHDGVPVPKVIDFGIAKATEGRLTDATVYTQLHQFIGTPAYMSPEQAEMSGLDIDTRSDIYALGVLLYELLVGSTPFDGKELIESGLDAMRKTIREKEPVRPSTKLSQTLVAADVRRLSSKSKIQNPKSKIDEVSSRRLLQIKELVNALRGDLDWIVMKCLEKDRTRRYETANGLAADIQRHLDNEPITARPPTTAYRIQKAFRRNKLAFGAAVTISAALILGLGIATAGWRQARAERDGAVKARGEAETARTAESSQRQRAQSEAVRAEEESLRARQFQYASDMNLAHQAVDDGNLFRTLQLLDRHRPQGESKIQNPKSKIDMRGWEWRYLWTQCEGEQLFILGSHSNGVTAVGFLPNGKTAFSAGKDNAVRLWDMKSMRQIGLLPHAANVTGAACSPDGRWMATSTEERNNPLLLWDLATQQPTSVLLTNFWLRPNTLAFSPDSKLLAFVNLRPGVHVWSLATGKVIAQLPAYHHWLGPQGLAFSPDGQTLAYTENEAGDIVLWNVRDQSAVQRLKGHTWYVTSLAFTPDGQLLISGSADRTAKLWDVTSGVERSTFTNYNVGLGALDVSSLRLSPDGKMLATAANGGGLRITVQEIPSGREIIRFRGHQHLVTDGAFSPDERTFISGSLDGTVRLWDLTPAPKEIDHRQFPSDVDEFAGGTLPAFSLSPDGLHLLTIFTNRTFSVWEMPALREGPRHPLPVSRAASAALATGGQLAAFVAADGNVVFWRGDTGETNWFARPTTNRTDRAVFSLDGRRLALGGVRDVAVCDVPSRRKLFTFLAGDDAAALFSLAFSSDSQKLMAGFFSGLVKVWDFSKRVPEVTLRGHDFQVNGLALLPDGRTLVSAAKDIRFWDLGSHTMRMVLNPRPVPFRGAAISTDGRRLAVGANDGLITIWDLASKQEVATLAGHTRPLLALSFLPDGNTLVSIGVDQVRIWRAATLQEADAHTAAEPQPKAPH